MTELDSVYIFKVVQSYPQVPTEWKSDQSHARSFAIFYESHVKKGKYKMNTDGKVSELQISASLLAFPLPALLCCLQGMILTLPGNQGSLRQHLATLSTDSTKLCVTSYSCSSGTGLFMCQHANPNHFHLYKLHKF